jgi:serine/threonine protein kinase/tetratricopeptide (TPR) repeat protein
MLVAPGTRLGPYAIVAPLGAGGMGEVWKARDTRLDRDIAIKFLNEDMALESRSLARFRVEARSIAAMSHPNILSIFDAELQHPPLYLVTELLEGRTLRQSIESCPLPWRRALEVGVAIADGLAAAHDAGIVHRDLKPENIFLTRQGTVKILDFGLAQFKDDARFEPSLSSLTPTLTDAGLMMGTVGYLAPEQARGEAVTAATDMFSFGCVLYEMVSGRRAFHRSTPGATVGALLYEQPKSLAEYVDDLPPELDRWIARCLTKERESRPQSARDLALILRDLLDQREPGKRTRERGASPAVESLAVLPFLTSTTSPDAEYLADGITESLINNFAQLSHLRVVARSAVFRHKGKEVDPLHVGRELGVNAVLTGRIFQRGDILVIAAELADVRDGSQIWGQQYKRQFTDIFAIQDEISTEISQRLRVHFTAEEQSRLTRRYTESPEAYQLYLKGRYCWNKRTIEGMRQALTYFEHAVETDPSYARAYTGLADCTSMLAIYGALDPRQAVPRAKAAQEQALQIDPQSAEAHASRGFSLLLFDWRFREAEHALRRAVELNAGYPSAHQWLGFALGLTGRTEEALAALKIAQQLDPFSASIKTTAVWPFFWTRQFDSAIERFRDAVELHPGYWVAHYFLGLSQVHKGDYGPGIIALRHAADIGDSSWRYAGLGYAYAKMGEPGAAREVLTTLQEMSSRHYVPPGYFAAVYAGLAETGLALDYLERAGGEHNWEIAWLHLDPFWDSLRGEARFQRLTQALDL